MTNGTAATGGRALLRLIKALQRTGAFAEVEEHDGLTRCVRVSSGSGPEADVIHHAALGAWRQAVAEGLVEIDGDDRTWRLSAAGRHRATAKKHADEKQTDTTRTTAEARSDGAESRHRTSQAAPAENLRESPLAWLHKRRDKSGVPLISEVQFHAGERLRADYEIGQLMPRVTIDWQRLGNSGGRSSVRPGQSLEISEAAMAARERVNRALVAVGPELSNLVIDVCCHLKGLEQLERAAGWPQRSAKIVLQVALSTLARHYGMDRGPGDGRRPIRHWGVDDYRPQILSDEPGAGPL